MKRKTEKTRMSSAFTIVELLTVMSIIIILIGILVPGLTQIKRYALYVKQKNQLSAIGKALEFYNVEHQGYPDSAAFDKMNVPYCGAMKLCEAMVGQDFLGFNPESRFLQDGTNGLPLNAGGKDLYPARSVPPNPPRGSEQQIAESIRERKDVALPLETASAYRLGDIYSGAALASLGLLTELPVLCDVYNKTMNIRTGKNIGMPILYYKANTTNISHNPALPPQANIYNYRDNQAIIDVGLPWDPQHAHPLADPLNPVTGGKPTPDGFPTNPTAYYEQTRNTGIDVPNGRPYKADSFILMSAGFDGLYGTKDDVFDFERQ